MIVTNSLFAAFWDMARKTTAIRSGLEAWTSLPLASRSTSRNVTATAVAPAILPLSTFGGRYVAQANDDGTFNFLGVPIVGELAKGARPDYPELAIDREWLDEALAAMNAGAADDYLPPLNVNHHNSAKSPERVGFVRGREVRKIRYRGSEMYALFADLERVPLGVATQIARGELPYCSIEGTIAGKPTIKALALLTDMPPQFGFPIITAGSVIGADDAPGAQPWSLAESTYRIFRFAYEGEGEEKPDEKTADEGATDEEKSKGKVAPDEGKGDTAQVLGEILLHLRKLCAVLLPPEEERQNLDPETGTRGPVGTKKSDEPAEKKTPEESTMSDPKTDAALAALTDKVTAMTAKEAAREAEAAALALASAAETALKAEGYALGDATKTALMVAAREGEAKLGAFVAAVKEVGTKDPHRTLDAALASGQKVAALGTDDEALVAKFAGTDANAGEIGRKALRAYPAYRAGAPRPMSKERWIEMSIAGEKTGEFAFVSESEFEKDDS